MCVVGRLTDADYRLCGVLNNSPYVKISLNTCSPLVKQFVPSPVWEMCVTLFEKKCSWRQTRRFQKAFLFTSVFFLLRVCGSGCELQLLLQHHACLPGTMLQDMMIVDPRERWTKESTVSLGPWSQSSSTGIDKKLMQPHTVFWNLPQLSRISETKNLLLFSHSEC